MMKTIAGLVLVVGLTACSYPVTQTKAVDARPTLSIDGAPQGSQLLIDGLVIGAADAYRSGKKSLRLQPGTHLVRVEHAGQVLLEEKVYLSDGLFKILTVQGK